MGLANCSAASQLLLGVLGCIHGLPLGTSAARGPVVSDPMWGIT